MPPAAAQARQAALMILVEVALDGAPGDVGVGGDLVVTQAVALEPEDLHLALDAGVGVVVTVVGQSFPVVRREGDDPHDGSTRCCSQVVPRRQFTLTHCRLQFMPDPAAPSIIAPRIASYQPVGLISQDVSSLRVRFSEPIKAGTFTRDDVVMRTPGGILDRSLI